MKLKAQALLGLFFLGWTICSAAQDILDHWHLRDSRGLTKVRFLNGQFVGVGTNGTILTSADGRVWTARNSGTTNDLRSVTWGQAPFPDGPAFVAVGKAGTIVKSLSAVNWTLVTTPYSCDLNDVTYGGFRSFLAATTAVTTDTPNFLISASGTGWDGIFVPGAQPWFGSPYRMDAVFATSDTFVAAGTPSIADEIWQSRDGGYTWTNRGLADQIVNGVGYANSRIVMIGWEGRPIISTNNGDNWFFSDDTNVCRAPLHAGNCDFGKDITYGASSFVVVRSFIGSLANRGLLTSSDGLIWTNRLGLTGLEIDTIAFGNGTFVAAGPPGIYRAEVVAPVLTAQRLTGSNAIHLTISGEVGRYRLQSSTNFSSWAEVVSFTNTGPPYDFVEPVDTKITAQFYRVVSP
jgi:hypothetical protein